MPLVSIILPYYKKISYFEKTYKSILSQSYKNYELIIIYDDEDRADLKKILKIIKKNPKVKIFCNNLNLGAGLSRNIGIKHSKGKLVSFIDADDLWSKDKVYKQVNFLLNNNYKFISCNYKKKFRHKLIKVTPPKKISYLDLINNCQIGLSTVMLKKEVINKKLFPKLKTQEDLAAWLKIMRVKKISCFNLNQFLVTWRHDKKSLSTNIFQKFKDSYKVFKSIENFSFIKTITCVFILSLNSIQRKF
jgi:teichuronic acid biosynthesis glycosyltransferase TuaG